jgi:predicted transcriptional regulator
MATTTTAISLDEELLTRINKRASELQLSLSRLLALAAEEYLDSHARRSPSTLRGERTARRIREINQAWVDGLDAEERAVLRGMRKKYRAVVKDPW